MSDTSTTFTDSEDRSWNVSLDIGICRTVKKELGLDLANAFKTGAFEEMSNDVYLFVDVLLICLRKPLAAKEVSTEQLAEAMNVEILEEATEAFQNAFANFTGGTRAEVLQRVQKRQKAHVKKQSKKLREVLEDPELDGKIDSILESGMTLNSKGET